MMPGDTGYATGSVRTAARSSGSMMKGRALLGAAPHGPGLDALDGPLQVVEQHAAQVVTEPVADDHAQHSDVLHVRRHGVRRDEPALDAQHLGDVEDRVV